MNSLVAGSDDIRPARLVVLGASNVRRSFAAAAHAARTLLGPSTHLFAAMGHGRSYGTRSRVLGRSLPAILECGIWSALGENSRLKGNSAPSRTLAVITDVGNDILYGASADTIGDWLETCITRLRDHEARLVMTALPIERLRRVRRWQFHVLQRILYPSRGLSYARAMRTIDLLHDRMTDLAAKHGIPLLDMPVSWYGIDPIHILPRYWDQAWRSMIEAACDGPPTAMECDPPSWSERWRLRWLTPAEWRLLGVRRGCSQPCFCPPRGGPISLF